MEMTPNKITFRFFDIFLYGTSLIFTLITAITFFLCFFDIRSYDHFSASSVFYVISVFMYALTRHVIRRKFPDISKHRRNEYFVLFWLTIGLFATTSINFFYPEKLKLLESLGYLVGWITFIFGFNYGVKLAVDRWIPKD